MSRSCKGDRQCHKAQQMPAHDPSRGGNWPRTGTSIVLYMNKTVLMGWRGLVSYMKTIGFVLVTCNIHFNVAEGRVVSSFVCHGKWLPVQHFHLLRLKNKRQKPCCETEETVFLSLTSLLPAESGLTYRVPCRKTCWLLTEHKYLLIAVDGIFLGAWKVLYCIRY